MNVSGPGSTRPFVDRPITDRDAALAAAEAAATEWGLAPPEPWRTSMNAIFRSGDVVMRVGHTSAPPRAALELATFLTAHDVRVPRPHPVAPLTVGDLAVTAWERLEQRDVPVQWEEVGAMVARVHSLDPALLPPEYPLADPRDLSWWKFEEMLADILADLDPDARAGLGRAVERNSDWVGFALGESVVCHGDVHPGNVMMVDDGVALLDWDLMCLAPPGWDHAPLLRWHERWGGGAYYEPFAEGYGWSARGDRFTESVAELRLVAATVMRIRDAPIAPEAQAEAELRLRYWRGDPDAPPWTAR